MAVYRKLSSSVVTRRSLCAHIHCFGGLPTLGLVGSFRNFFGSYLLYSTPALKLNGSPVAQKRFAPLNVRSRASLRQQCELSRIASVRLVNWRSSINLAGHRSACCNRRRLKCFRYLADRECSYMLFYAYTDCNFGPTDLFCSCACGNRTRSFTLLIHSKIRRMR